MPLTNTIKYFDASDALAVAVCHHFNAHGLVTTVAATKKNSRTKKSGGWEDFIKNNPGRIG
jgi:crossover junction endodeoxyribonuclease RuvC